MTDESSGELPESLSDSDSAYEPVTSSGSDTESEEERVPVKRRRSGVEQQPTTSRAVPSTSSAVPSTSSAVPLQQRPGTSRVSSQPQRDRGLPAFPMAFKTPCGFPLIPEQQISPLSLPSQVSRSTPIIFPCLIFLIYFSPKICYPSLWPSAISTHSST